MSTLPNSYFDDIYQKNADPWDFVNSEYEKKKYEDSVSVLTKGMYENAFEIGCSIGVLTKLLAAKTKKLLAIDVSDAPLEEARKRLVGEDHVEFKKMSVPAEFPEQQFDLIILSEVGYYLSMEDLHKLRALCMEHLSIGGSLLLVHWLPTVHDYPLTGDQVHETFYEMTANNTMLKITAAKRLEKYRLDLFERI